MSELGVETFHKVSGTVEVRDGNGKAWQIEYVANLSDREDTCYPEIPIDYDGRLEAVMEACYADAYRRIDEMDQADQTDFASLAILANAYRRIDEINQKDAD